MANACFLALYACCYLLVLVLAGWFDPGFDGGGDWFWFGDRFASLGIAITLNIQFSFLNTIQMPLKLSDIRPDIRRFLDYLA